MNDSSNLRFIRQRIAPPCHSLIDIFTTNDRHCQLAAADRWLLEATTSHFGQSKFVWAELLTDLAHCYPLTEDDNLTMQVYNQTLAICVILPLYISSVSISVLTINLILCQIHFLNIHLTSLQWA